MTNAMMKKQRLLLCLAGCCFIGLDAFHVNQQPATTVFFNRNLGLLGRGAQIRLQLAVDHNDCNEQKCEFPHDEECPKRGLKFPPSMYKNKKRERGTTTTNDAVSIPSNRDFSDKGFSDGMLNQVEREALKTRLLDGRYYANKESFDLEHLHKAPGLQDLDSPQLQPTIGAEGFWINPLARVISFVGACIVFPFIMALLERFVTMSPDQLDNITSQFGPGISILYGTFLSLTLSILYQRQRAITDTVAAESALLVMALRTALNIFKGCPNHMVEAGQTVADQVRTLVKSSRGVEMMQIMYSDPYALLMEQINKFEEQISTEELARKGHSINYCRDLLKDLTRIRSNRLAEEARALPPTHFLILNTMTSLILLSFCVSVLPTIDRIGAPSTESTLIFALLTTTYVLFYNFADDLNNPFGGVYQVRRSTAASHLLEAKWLVANHPELRGKVDFEEVDEDQDRVLIRTPGLGDTWFVKNDFYVSVNNNNDAARENLHNIFPK